MATKEEIRACAYRLHGPDAERVIGLADQLDVTPGQVIHELLAYALDHVSIGPVTRNWLVFDGAPRKED